MTCPLCGNMKGYTLNALGAHCEGMPCGQCGCNIRNRFFYHVWNDKAAELAARKRVRALEVAGYGYAKLGAKHVETANKRGIDLLCGDFYERDFRAERYVDLCDLQFGDNELDLIGHSHVQEHIEQDTLAMRECYRCLSPGGSLVFSLPVQTDFTFPVSGEFHGDNAPVFRRNGWDIVDKLLAVGFRVSVLVPCVHFAICPTQPHLDDQYVLDDIRLGAKFGRQFEKRQALFHPASLARTSEEQGFDKVWGQLEVFCATKPLVT